MDAHRNHARAILERELQSLRKMLALEINKARWLEEGDIDQTAAAQELSDEILTQMTPLAHAFAELPEGRRPKRETIGDDPALGSLYKELTQTVEQIRNLSGRNQLQIKRLMKEVASNLRHLHKGRKAMRGYNGPRPESAPLLEGKL